MRGGQACALWSIVLLSLCILYLLSSSAAPGQAPERPAAKDLPPTAAPEPQPQPADGLNQRTSHKLRTGPREHAPRLARRERPTSLPSCVALRQWDDSHFSHDQDWVPLADGLRVQPDTLWPVLTCTPYRSRSGRTEYTYQPPACGAYRRRRAACAVRRRGPMRTRTSLGVPCVPRTVAIQALALVGGPPAQQGEWGSAQLSARRLRARARQRRAAQARRRRRDNAPRARGRAVRPLRSD